VQHIERRGAALGHDDRPFHGVLQLPYVAWPRVGLRPLQIPAVETRQRDVEARAGQPREVRHEQRDVLATIAERRHLHREDAEAVVQIETEASFRLAVDRALTDLASLDADQARIVELRYFSGMTVEETAQALGVSPRTVKREWRVAKAWLHERLSAR